MSMEIEIDLKTGARMGNCPPVGVAFGLCPTLDKKASALAGHEVWKEIEYVKIGIPGDKFSLYFQPADERQRRRFPSAYEAFKKRTSGSVMEGLPIEQWAPISRSLALTLRAANVNTVEALATLHDTHLDKLGFGVKEMRAKAQSWLREASEGAETSRLAGEKEALQRQLAAMQAQIADLVKAGSPQAQVKVAPRPEVSTEDVMADVVSAARRPRARKAS